MGSLVALLLVSQRRLILLQYLKGGHLPALFLTTTNEDLLM